MQKLKQSVSFSTVVERILLACGLMIWGSVNFFANVGVFSPAESAPSSIFQLNLMLVFTFSLVPFLAGVILLYWTLALLGQGPIDTKPVDDAKNKSQLSQKTDNIRVS